MGSSEYRQYLFPHDHPRLSGIRGLDAYGYREAAKKDEFTGGLINGWEPLYLAPFRGVSENGDVHPELHSRLPVPRNGRRSTRCGRRP